MRHLGPRETRSPRIRNQTSDATNLQLVSWASEGPIERNQLAQHHNGVVADSKLRCRCLSEAIVRGIAALIANRSAADVYFGLCLGSEISASGTF